MATAAAASFISSLVQWLQQGGPRNAKHNQSLKHACVVTFLFYLLSFGTLQILHDLFFASSSSSNDNNDDDEASSSSEQSQQSNLIAWFLIIYYLTMFGIRFFTASSPYLRPAIVYELMWLCNTTILIGGTLGRNRPIIAQSACIVVGIDQLLWYVDLASYLISRRGRFLVGVCKYLFWKETHWSTILTCTHHLWTIPLLLWYSCIMKKQTLDRSAWLLSIPHMMIHVAWPRFVAPIRVEAVIDDTGTRSSSSDKKKDDKIRDENVIVKKYLNINLSHELWKDISLSFLQISHDDPPMHIYLARLLWRWQLLNTLVYLFLQWIVRIVLL